jgi:cytochrome b pre-mRNA-processing protein 3
MLAFWRRQDPVAAAAELLYGACVRHARSPAFYRDHGVPDTLEGRFDMIVLPVFGTIYRLQAEGSVGERMGQAVLETFFRSIDDDMRELGVGDLSVPRKIHKAASAFYGRSKAYAGALAGDGDLAVAISRNVFDAGNASGSAALASHLTAIVVELQNQPVEQLLAGQVHFPPVS